MQTTGQYLCLIRHPRDGVARLKFDPILPNHAIERCALSIAFTESLPNKGYIGLVETIAPMLSGAGLPKRTKVQSGFIFDARTGVVTPEDKANGPTTFSTTDDTSQLTLFPDSIYWVTSNYVRWKQFAERFKAVSGEILQHYSRLLDVKLVKLEYWDRFVWTGDWSDIDYSLILNADSGMFPSVMTRSTEKLPKREWHSHMGWFEFPQGIARRLTHVNVDVIEVMDRINGQNRPSVGIYTMKQDEFDASQVVNVHEAANTLHVSLKDMFRNIVTDSAALRVSLDGPHGSDA